MLKRTRGKKEQTIGRGFALLLAFVLVSLVVGYLAFISGVETERGQRYADAYVQSAKDDAKRACIGMETSLAFECVYERVEASQSQANARLDLEAQQWMRFWAAVMAFIALASVILTAAALWYIRGTLLETEKIARDSKRTANASQDATRAMIEANRLAKKMGEAQVRCYISITDVKIRISPFQNNSFDIVFKLKNSGNSPVRNIRFSVETRWVNARKSADRIEHEAGPIMINDYFAASGDTIMETIPCPDLAYFGGDWARIGLTDVILSVKGEDVFRWPTRAEIYCFSFWGEISRYDFLSLQIWDPSRRPVYAPLGVSD